jgi:hypothetical protein
MRTPVLRVLDSRKAVGQETMLRMGYALERSSAETRPETCQDRELAE